MSKHLGIWRLPSRDAQRLVPGLAVDGSVVDFEAEQPRWRTVRESADDPLRPQEWWLAMIDADRIAPPGPGRPLTVVDSGVDMTHPEFASRPDTRVLGEQRLVGNTEFHGTAVSSVAAAPANGVGLVGVYPAALLGIWDASPRGILTSSAVIQGIEAALSLGRGVINLSIGGTTRSGFEELAIFDAVARGSIVVAASGNEREEGDPPNYPASLPHVLTVGAIGQNGAVTSFSSTSVGMDVVAPGESIVAAVPSWLSPDLLRDGRRHELRVADGGGRDRLGLDGAARARRQPGLGARATQRARPRDARARRLQRLRHPRRRERALRARAGARSRGAERQHRPRHRGRAPPPGHAAADDAPPGPELDHRPARRRGRPARRLPRLGPGEAPGGGDG